MVAHHELELAWKKWKVDPAFKAQSLLYTFILLLSL